MRAAQPRALSVEVRTNVESIGAVAAAEALRAPLTNNHLQHRWRSGRGPVQRSGHGSLRRNVRISHGIPGFSGDVGRVVALVTIDRPLSVRCWCAAASISIDANSPTSVPPSASDADNSPLIYRGAAILTCLDNLGRPDCSYGSC